MNKIKIKDFLKEIGRFLLFVTVVIIGCVIAFTIFIFLG
tara:strand:- start:262 stop:378 length:117 start_codon:yes stop_codon:yes gene_type:complete